MSSSSEPNERVMNDTTMPPPSSSSSSQPPRHKTGRFGLSEWNRLLQLSKDLAQRKGQPLRKISLQEVQQHKSLHDGWIILRGKVYNLSPYIAYHPGGESILRGVLGKDATRLYDKYHRWVNEENLIGKLLLGYLDTSSSSSAPPTSRQSSSTDKDGFDLPAPRPPPQILVDGRMMLETKGTNAEDDEQEDVVGAWEDPNAM